MENFFSRYKNPLVLMAVLFVQVVYLATQVHRPDNAKFGGAQGPTLIRVWTVTAITPVERLLVSTGHFVRSTWHNYIDLHNVRKQNIELQEEVARLKVEQARLSEDAHQAQRLQAVLEFKERYIGNVVPAQVIGTGGTDRSRVIYIDKGSHDGLQPDMPVITPDGIVGKIKDVMALSSLVLLINDRESGAGVIMENSRLQGVLHGTPAGDLNVTGIMSDEKIALGEPVVTSGGDRIYPKGVPVGTVVSKGADNDNPPFLAIKIKPAADLNRLEEVLVVTRIAEQTPAVAGPAPQRAADILAERLPSVSKNDANAAKPAAGAAGTASNSPATGQSQTVPPKGVVKKIEASPLGQKPEQKKTTGVPPAPAGQSGASAPLAGPAAGSAATPKPTRTPVLTAPTAAPGAAQPKAGQANQVKKPRPQASPSPSVTPSQPETATPESEPPPSPSSERPPR